MSLRPSGNTTVPVSSVATRELGPSNSDALKLMTKDTGVVERAAAKLKAQSSAWGGPCPATAVTWQGVKEGGHVHEQVSVLYFDAAGWWVKVGQRCLGTMPEQQWAQVEAEALQWQAGHHASILSAQPQSCPRPQQLRQARCPHLLLRAAAQWQRGNAGPCLPGLWSRGTREPPSCLHSAHHVLAP